MAGRIHLAVTGIQDQWLTGEPQFSYFVMNYRRHTRFSTETVEIPFTFNAEEGRKPRLGNSITCRIPDNVGDLLRSVTLNVTLEPLPVSDNELISNTYNTSIGTRIIEHADLIIGGQTIERLTGDYIYMYDQIHNNIDDTQQTLYFMTGHNNHIQFSKPYTFYVNLPFYFFRHPSLAIPLCAINKQLVEIRVKFKPSDYKISYTYDQQDPNIPIAIPTNDGAIKSVSLLTDFYFITDVEKNFLRTRPVEYVITQVQAATIPFGPNVLARSVMTDFKHPVKEMYFMANVQERETVTQGGKQILGGIVAESDRSLYLSQEINVRSDVRFIKNISLEFNESIVFDHDRLQLSYQQSLDHHTGGPSPAYEFYTYSFALEPEMYHPTGQVNMSRIRHQKLNIELDETDALNDIHVTVYAVNYNILHVESGLAGLKF